MREAVNASKAKAAATRRRKATEVQPAEADPVARVLVDLPLAHLDKPFDYLVPTAMAEQGGGRRPGEGPVRRPGRRRVPGRAPQRLRPHRPAGAAAPRRQRRARPQPRRSPRCRPRSPSGTPAPAPTCSGSRSRRGTPPPRRSRHPRRRPRASTRPPDEAAWADHEHGPAFLQHLADGGAPRAVWSAAPATDWPLLLAHAAAAAYASGRGALLCVPDKKDLDRLDAALTAGARRGPPRRRSPPTAAPPPATATSSPSAAGARRIVAGTRAAQLRPGPRPRPGRDLGRRRRPARRAARAVPPHPRDAPAARRAGRDRRPGRRVRPHRRGGVPAPLRLGPRDRATPRGGPRAGVGQRRRRLGAGAATRPERPRRAACRRRRPGRSATASSPARCWCRRPGSATSPASPASAAAHPPAAACAPARSR